MKGERGGGLSKTQYDLHGGLHNIKDTHCYDIFYW